ncbi:unnamed protein product, partial [Rangifer tarandus platyrhynchus]
MRSDCPELSSEPYHVLHQTRLRNTKSRRATRGKLQNCPKSRGTPSSAQQLEQCSV